MMQFKSCALTATAAGYIHGTNRAEELHAGPTSRAASLPSKVPAALFFRLRRAARATGIRSSAFGDRKECHKLGAS
jgi:hypothetical protein